VEGRSAVGLLIDRDDEGAVLERRGAFQTCFLGEPIEEVDGKPVRPVVPQELPSQRNRGGDQRRDQVRTAHQGSEPHDAARRRQRVHRGGGIDLDDHLLLARGQLVVTAGRERDLRSVQIDAAVLERKRDRLLLLVEPLDLQRLAACQGPTAVTEAE
jgi:hypothetical protein